MIFDLAQDFHDALAAMPPEHPKRRALDSLADAIVCSTHVLLKDSCQLGTQLEGRMCDDTSVFIAVLLQQGRRKALRPCFRPLTASLLSAGSGLLRTFEGHTDEVSAVAISPDGRTAVSASDDRTLRGWELTTGRELFTLRGHSHWVRAVAITPDGLEIISGSADQTLALWDLRTGRRVGVLRGHTGGITALAIDPDGAWAVSAADDRTIRLWDLRTREGRVLAQAPRTVYGLAYSPRASCVFGASSDGWVRSWSIPDGTEKSIFNAYTALHSVAITPDGRLVLAAGSNGAVILSDLASGRQQHYTHSIVGEVRAVAAVSCDQFVSAGRDRTVKLWDSRQKEPFNALAAHADTVNAIAITRNGTLMFTGSRDGTAKLWHLSFERLGAKRASPRARVLAMGMTSDGGRVITVVEDRQVEEWNTSNGDRIHCVQGPKGSWRRGQITVLPDSRRVLLVSPELGANLWGFDTEEDHYFAIDSGHFHPWRLGVAPGERFAVCACENGVVKLWDLEARQEVAAVDVHLCADAVAVSPDGRFVALGDYEGRIGLWNLMAPESICWVGAHSAPVTSLALTGDRTRLVTGHEDGAVYTWEIDQRRHVRCIPAHEQSVCCVAVMSNSPLKKST